MNATAAMVGSSQRSPSMRHRAWLLAQRASRRAGFDLVRRHFYSPLPNIDDLPESLWDRAAPLPGVDLGVSRALELLAAMTPFIREFEDLMEKGETRFRLGNGTYDSVDAELLYAMVRHWRPRRIVELGSGSSSHVVDIARRQNEREGFLLKHEILDPYPWTATTLGPIAEAALLPIGVSDLDPGLLSGLAENDILFVDTTHTVKTGGDVNRILLELVPRLAPGVLIHFHDIFLPYEYPRRWVVDDRRAWAEQYLLQAFLACNQDFDVVTPAHVLAREHPDQLRRAVTSFGPGVAPGAFWIRRRSDSGLTDESPIRPTSLTH